METSLGKGIFLVAAPSLRDPNFRQAVVLLCEYGPEGTLGLVINRTTAMNITEVLPQVPVLESQGHMIFSGGPVQRSHLLLLYRTTEGSEETHHVFDGVYLSGDLSILKDLLKNPSGSADFMAFMGYAGWAPGQLEYEMKTGSWLTLPSDSSCIFGRNPAGLWGDILRLLGGQYALYSDMPLDPQMN